MNRSNKALLLILATFVQFCLSTVAYGLSSEMTRGADYLINNQDADGSWSIEIAANAFYSTYEASNALYMIDPQLLNYSSGFNFVSADPVENTVYFRNKILALKVLGGDYSDVLTALLINRKEDGGFGGDADTFADVFHTAVALQTLKAVNYPDQNIISSALFYLTSTQNTDGGWGFYQGDDSNVYMTAMVLNTLSQFKSTYDLQIPINNAVAYLRGCFAFVELQACFVCFRK
jgi:large repetitive protein